MSCFDNESCMSDTTNTFGLDYFDIINNSIKSILYPKPQLNYDLIHKLKNKKENKFFYIKNEQQNLKICVCQIMLKTFNSDKTTHNKIPDKIIVFSHGNGCDIFTFYEYLELLASNLNVIVISYDYPSYGLSEGELNEFTCYKSLEMVIEHCVKIYPDKQILLVGQSLGTGIVINYIKKYKWTNPVILISPYMSIPKVVSELSIVECLVSKNKFASYTKISNVKCPIKIFHGKSDKVISHSHCLELYELLPNKKLKPKLYDNVGHNDILNYIDFDEYNKILQLV